MSSLQCHEKSRSIAFPTARFGNIRNVGKTYARAAWYASSILVNSVRRFARASNRHVMADRLSGKQGYRDLARSRAAGAQSLQIILTIHLYTQMDFGFRRVRCAIARKRISTYLRPSSTSEIQHTCIHRIRHPGYAKIRRQRLLSTKTGMQLLTSS